MTLFSLLEVLWSGWFFIGLFPKLVTATRSSQWWNSAAESLSTSVGAPNLLVLLLPRFLLPLLFFPIHAPDRHVGHLRHKSRSKVLSGTPGVPRNLFSVRTAAARKPRKWGTEPTSSDQCIRVPATATAWPRSVWRTWSTIFTGAIKLRFKTGNREKMTQMVPVISAGCGMQNIAFLIFASWGTRRWIWALRPGVADTGLGIGRSIWTIAFRCTIQGRGCREAFPFIDTCESTCCGRVWRPCWCNATRCRTTIILIQSVGWL